MTQHDADNHLAELKEKVHGGFESRKEITLMG
jgi:hypothetical protein